MPRPMLISLAAVCLTSSAQSTDSLIEGEMARLRACPAVYKTSPPPVNVRVAWRSPEDFTAMTGQSGLVRIQFVIHYEQSDFFDTAAEADRVTDLHPMMELRQRNYYVREASTLHLQYRESLIGKKWQRQTDNAPNLSCWQTSPPTNATP